MPEPILNVENLSISFRARGAWRSAVSGVSFFLNPGEILSLVGESGCGKSVTALSLLRLLPEPPARIDGGTVRYRGTDLFTLPLPELRKVRGKEIGMVFQEPMTSLNPVLSVGNQIAETIRIHERVGGTKARDRAVEAMAAVGIPGPQERFDTYPHRMSGGLRQRVMIAMALACRPAILIADEPTTALDVTIQAQILELIGRLRTEKGMGVILITHDLGVVAETADRVAVMYVGTIMETAEVRELFANPLHPYTQALRRSLPEPGQKKHAARLPTIAGRVPPLGEVPSHCRFFDRCPKAGPECKVGEPALREVRPGHFVRCVKV
ncbi:MAG: ABC transporter ATP-binding protein [Pseudomonadota bacterium]